MTDLMKHNILDQMSSAFNKEAIPDSEKLTLNEDATLKWRGLLNNTYAAKDKDGRDMRKRSTGSVSKATAEEGNSTMSNGENEGDGNGGAKETISAADNSSTNNNGDDDGEKYSTAEVKPVEQEASNSGEAVEEKIAVEGSAVSSPPTTIVEAAGSGSAVIADNVTCDKSQADKARVKTRTSKSSAVQSDRSLRSKANSDSSKGEKSPSLPSGVKRGRGRKKPPEAAEEPDTTTEIKTEVTATVEPAAEPAAEKKPPVEVDTVTEEKRDGDKPRLIMKIRQNRSVVLPDQVDAAPKRRGRKPRMQLIPEGRQTRSKETELKSTASQRPLRRIKPTPKILASDELREGFVQQHCARLSGVAADELKTEQNEEIKNESKGTKGADDAEKRQTRDKRRREGLKFSNAEKTPPVTATQAENSDGKKNPQVAVVALDSKSIKRSLFFADTAKSVPRRPCPDPSDFLREIKNSKLNIHRSPELSKLNKKQLKKLLKGKEKHFQSLGLQKVKRANDTESEDNSDENEEFVPKRRVENVGKSGVTLRLRTFRKDGKDGSGKSGDHQGRKKRPRDTASSNESPVPSKRTLASTDIDLSNELQVVPAGPSTTVIDVDDMHLICFCAQPSKYFLQRTAAISHCCAIDEIEGQKIGCTNEVHGDLLQLLRPSVRTSYMVLCDSHKKRLVSHNCCAGCGIFLTQGIFSLCPEKHFFHRDCTMKYILNAPYDPNSPDFQGPTLAFKCPHCGTDTPDNSFRVTMKSENIPVFFTNQKHHVQRAKMAVSNRPQVSANSFLLNVERLIPDNVVDALRKTGEQLKHQPPKVFTAKDLFYAIYNDAGADKIAEIIGEYHTPSLD